MASRGENVHLIIKGQDSEEVHFKIKSATPLKRLFDKYCDRNNVRDRESVVFLYENKRLNGSQTVDSLGMVNEDIIYVVSNQSGGN